MGIHQRNGQIIFRGEDGLHFLRRLYVYADSEKQIPYSRMLGRLREMIEPAHYCNRCGKPLDMQNMKAVPHVDSSGKAYALIENICQECEKPHE